MLQAASMVLLYMLLLVVDGWYVSPGKRSRSLFFRTKCKLTSSVTLSNHNVKPEPHGKNIPYESIFFSLNQKPGDMDRSTNGSTNLPQKISTGIHGKPNPSGGIFVDWHLKPSGHRGALKQLMAAIDRAEQRHGLWCLGLGARVDLLAGGLGMVCFFFGGGVAYKSGQIIATSHEFSP